MRTLQRFATVCFIGAAFAALFSACSSSDTPATTGAGSESAGAAGAHAGGATGAAGGPAAAGATAAAGAGTAGASGGLVGNPANGLAAFNSGMCNSCHGTMGEGALGPNISGSKPYGIGNWTEPQFHDAVRLGKDKSGVMLYLVMAPNPPSTISDQGIADLYAYLIAHPVETAQAGSYCTGTCTATH